MRPAQGRTDDTGALTARTIAVSAPTNGACQGGFGGRAARRGPQRRRGLEHRGSRECLTVTDRPRTTVAGAGLLAVLLAAGGVYTASASTGTQRPRTTAPPS